MMAGLYSKTGEGKYQTIQALSETVWSCRARAQPAAPVRMA